MLMRFDPFRELDQMTQQMLRQTTRPGAPMDAYRHGDEFVVQFDFPGVDPGSIDLTVEKNVLNVSATRQRTIADGDEVLIAAGSTITLDVKEGALACGRAKQAGLPGRGAEMIRANKVRRAARKVKEQAAKG